MKIRLAALALLSLASHGFCAEPADAKIAPPAKASEKVEPARDYCRFVGDDLRGKLETVVVTMKNAAGVTVELVGAVHIADGAYYQTLNELFKTYEVLLFELVDGQNLKAQFEGEASKFKKSRPSDPKLNPNGASKEAPVAETTDEPDKPNKLPTKSPRSHAKKDDIAFTILHGMMTGLGTYLRLEYQTDGVDYSAKNFVHADVSMAEFQRLQAEKGESWGTLLQKSFEAQLKRVHGKDEEPKGGQLLLALLGDSSGIKISMAKMLGQLEGTASEIGFGGDSVIVGERNRVALEVFDREVKAGRKNLGIFYGAAHLTDMEKRLESRGYHRTAERWLTAWDIKPRVEEKK